MAKLKISYLTLSINCFSFPKNRPVVFVVVEVVDVVVSVDVVVVGVGEVVVGVNVKVTFVLEVEVVVIVDAVGGVLFAGSCAASKASQSIPISFPSDAAFL